MSDASEERWTMRRLASRAWHAVWSVDLASLPRWRRAWVRTVQIIHVVTQELINGELNLRASSLAYTTLLSLIPALAVSFAVMKGFDVHHQLGPLLTDTLAPLGDRATDVTAQVMEFVENLELKTLGSLGVAALLFTVVSMVLKVEQALNFVWHVNEPVGVLRRISGHLTVVMIGPALVFIAIGVIANFAASNYIETLLKLAYLGPVLSPIIAVASALLPYLLIAAAFTFVYLYLPGTQVHVGAAVLGALVGAALWAGIGWGFASLVVTSTRNTLLYSSFAIPVLFITWLYIGWLIFLVGGSVAYYFQHPEQLAVTGREPQVSNRVRERLALSVSALVARRFIDGDGPYTTVELARKLRAPLEVVEQVIGVLVSSRVLARTGDKPVSYLPARALDSITVMEILQAVRSAFERQHLALRRMRVETASELCAERFEAAVAGVVGTQTLAELALPVASAEVMELPTTTERPGTGTRA